MRERETETVDIQTGRQRDLLGGGREEFQRLNFISSIGVTVFFENFI